MIGLFEETANPLLGFFIGAFAEVMVTNPSGGVDEVVRGPVFIVEAAPDAIVAPQIPWATGMRTCGVGSPTNGPSTRVSKSLASSM